jgi:glycosyltransferase involved in cell wall biosynthesis
VVHDHSLLGPVAAPREVPYVVTAHSAGHHPFDEYYVRISGRVALVAISDAQRRIVADVRWAATIPNAVDVSAFDTLAQPDDYVLFLGRIAEEKGVHLAAMAARLAGVPLVIAGRIRAPAEHRYFFERVRPLLDDTVRYVGEAGTSASDRCCRAPAHCSSRSCGTSRSASSLLRRCRREHR